MFLIVGLGNPGAEYEDTRHNVGFMLADRAASVYGGRFKRGGRSLYAQTEIAGQDVIIVKPQTYMNLSGDSVIEFVRAHGIEASKVIAAYDDCDLPLGRVRVRPGGGSGGHRGVKSLAERLGTNEFPRVRLGIGRPPQGVEVADYVLSPFRKDEMEALEEILAKGLSSVEAIIENGVEFAMNRFNSAV